MEIHEIIEFMHELSAIHEELLRLAYLKKQTIIDNDVNQLTLITSQESKLMKRAEVCENNRTEAIQRYIEMKGFKPGSINLASDFAKLLFKSEEKAALAEAQGALQHVLFELKRSNALNQQLIEQSLAYIDYSLDLVMGPEDDAIYHNPQHQHHGSQRTGVFDAKA